MTVRERRVENEWKFLLRLEAENSSIIEAVTREKVCAGDCLHILLKQTTALALTGASPEMRTEHQVRFHFPEYFPAVPIEAFLSTPVFHPNVHPENGFVCLWNRFSPGDSVLEAVRQLQRVISWELFNAEADHLMQPEALHDGRRVSPMAYSPVAIPEDLRNERAFFSCSQQGTRRKRLS